MKFDITVLLDRSGSMETRKQDHIGGLRSFINDQKGQGETDFTLIQFDSGNPFELIIDGVDIESVNTDLVNLIPRGGTPLLDAVGKTIAHIEQRVQGKEVQSVLMIITDGEENQSREWTKERIQKAVKDKEDKWKILYLGANVDAFDEAANLGIVRSSALNFANTSKGTENMYHANTRGISRMRTAYTQGLSGAEALCAANYTDQDRTDAMESDEKTEVKDISRKVWKI